MKLRKIIALMLSLCIIMSVSVCLPVTADEAEVFEIITKDGVYNSALGNVTFGGLNMSTASETAYNEYKGVQGTGNWQSYADIGFPEGYRPTIGKNDKIRFWITYSGSAKTEASVTVQLAQWTNALGTARYDKTVTVKQNGPMYYEIPVSEFMYSGDKTDAHSFPGGTLNFFSFVTTELADSVNYVNYTLKLGQLGIIRSEDPTAPKGAIFADDFESYDLGRVAGFHNSWTKGVTNYESNTFTWMNGETLDYSSNATLGKWLKHKPAAPEARDIALIDENTGVGSGKALKITGQPGINHYSFAKKSNITSSEIDGKQLDFSVAFKTPNKYSIYGEGFGIWVADDVEDGAAIRYMSTAEGLPEGSGDLMKGELMFVGSRLDMRELPMDRATTLYVFGEKVAKLDADTVYSLNVKLIPNVNSYDVYVTLNGTTTKLAGTNVPTAEELGNFNRLFVNPIYRVWSMENAGGELYNAMYCPSEIIDPTDGYRMGRTLGIIDDIKLTATEPEAAPEITPEEAKPTPGDDSQLGNVLILGDSISSFGGAIAENCVPYYNPWSDWENSGVTSVDKTWWGQVIDRTKSILALNSSSSGSTICISNENGKAISFVQRVKALEDEGFFEENDIDTIFIHGGTNDSSYNVPIGELKYSDWTDDDLKNLNPALCYMIDTLKTKAPSARIIFVQNQGLSDSVNKSIKNACDYYGVEIIQLADIACNGVHPTAQGMTQIADRIIDVLDGNAPGEFPDSGTDSGDDDNSGDNTEREVFDIIESNGKFNSELGNVTFEGVSLNTVSQTELNGYKGVQGNGSWQTYANIYFPEGSRPTAGKNDTIRFWTTYTGSVVESTTLTIQLAQWNGATVKYNKTVTIYKGEPTYFEIPVSEFVSDGGAAFPGGDINFVSLNWTGLAGESAWVTYSLGQLGIIREASETVGESVTYFSDDFEKYTTIEKQSNKAGTAYDNDTLQYHHWTDIKEVPEQLVSFGSEIGDAANIAQFSKETGVGSGQALIFTGQPFHGVYRTAKASGITPENTDGKQLRFTTTFKVPGQIIHGEGVGIWIMDDSESGSLLDISSQGGIHTGTMFIENELLFIGARSADRRSTRIYAFGEEIGKVDNNTIYNYTLILTPEDDGTYSAQATLNGVTTKLEGINLPTQAELGTFKRLYLSPAFAMWRLWDQADYSGVANGTADEVWSMKDEDGHYKIGRHLTYIDNIKLEGVNKFAPEAIDGINSFDEIITASQKITIDMTGHIESVIPSKITIDNGASVKNVAVDDDKLIIEFEGIEKLKEYNITVAGVKNKFGFEYEQMLTYKASDGLDVVSVKLNDNNRVAVGNNSLLLDFIKADDIADTKVAVMAYVCKKTEDGKYKNIGKKHALKLIDSQNAQMSIENISVPDDSNHEYAIRVFVWDDYTNFTPVMKAATFEVE